ncbi:MAG: preprotein translocase subunit YajC [Mucilaginibacter sp.]|uniref:preprotein translocase subunit YajC n=1 Tax=Mucilaginibacter sp. L3T2-6 TaxID=3062491 RepID=UPI0026761E78|nr:preprotein translocase subunit YajC [Mucilaginibacter sp. L3T2-6]MDO3641157.1 preprotein translocase subunit YajC [Mucilaginibacter sp. L3T2-6]MDV6213367.1 preprotein translocase subunit YajC [Mucilaginibacter sp. L3T2-6]
MIATILLQASGTGMGMQQLVVFGLIALVFYFFMIRPQVKKQKDQKKYVNELKKGDKVVTTAGIHGRIADINDTTFLIEVDNGKIRFDKSAISLEASKALNTPAATK